MTRAARFAAAGLLLITLLVGATGVAAAHAVLVSTDPAQGAQLAAGPDRVSATFNEQLQTTFAAMTVVGPDQHLWSTGDAQVQGAVVSVGVRPLGPAGSYTVNYRVTSADGHVVSGSWAFQLTVPGAGDPGPPLATTNEPGGNMPIWPFVVGAVVIVGAGLWIARPKS
ncbi:MAG TPA: copper resistance CopC family protein [Mycobacterium sp.]|nr:copper resistance CopC family protein [Mycobacterium sp.]